MADAPERRQALFPEVIALAKQAGDAIMAIYRSGETGETSKADDSPLTLADLASHRIIAAGLSRLTPDIPVLSEEAAEIPYAVRRSTCRGGRGGWNGMRFEWNRIALQQSGHAQLGVFRIPRRGTTVA